MNHNERELGTHCGLNRDWSGTTEKTQKTVALNVDKLIAVTMRFML